MFSCTDCEPASNFVQANSEYSKDEEATFSASGLPPSGVAGGFAGKLASICPEKVFQAQMIEAALGFLTSVPTHCRQSLVDGSRRLPF